MATHKAWDKPEPRRLRILGCSICLRAVGQRGDPPAVKMGKAFVHLKCKRNGLRVRIPKKMNKEVKEEGKS